MRVLMFPSAAMILALAASACASGDFVASPDESTATSSDELTISDTPCTSDAQCVIPGDCSRALCALVSAQGLCPSPTTPGCQCVYLEPEPGEPVGCSPSACTETEDCSQPPGAEYAVTCQDGQCKRAEASCSEEEEDDCAAGADCRYYTCTNACVYIEPVTCEPVTCGNTMCLNTANCTQSAVFAVVCVSNVCVRGPC